MAAVELSNEELDALYSACFTLDQKIRNLVMTCNESMLGSTIGELAHTQEVLLRARRKIEAVRLAAQQQESPAGSEHPTG